jgi:uroporphyrinogen-III synthase
MRFLVTRPQPDAAETAARLTAMGHQALVQPLLAVEFADPPTELPRPAAILITSRNAVRALARWPQIDEWRDVPVFAAGPATGRAAAALGFRYVRGGAQDTGSLGEVVRGGLRCDAGPLVYPAARDRAGALAEGLTSQGYDLRVVEAYRAEPIDDLEPTVRKMLAAGTIDGVLLFSRRTAEAFVAAARNAGIAPAGLAKPTYYVISQHVGGALEGIAERVVAAERPDEDSLLALIPARR